MCATCEIYAVRFTLYPLSLATPSPPPSRNPREPASMTQIEVQECPLIRAEREASALWWSKDIQLFWLPLKDAKKGFRSEESGKPTFRLPLNYVTLGLHISDWTYRVSMLRLLRHSFSAVGILKTRKDREYII